MQTHFIEAKRLNPNDFCFCPLISHSNTTETEDNVRSSLSGKNKTIFDSINSTDINEIKVLGSKYSKAFSYLKISIFEFYDLWTYKDPNFHNSILGFISSNFWVFTF